MNASAFFPYFHRQGLVNIQLKKVLDGVGYGPQTVVRGLSFRLHQPDSVGSKRVRKGFSSPMVVDENGLRTDNPEENAKLQES
ncbi:hypothetical protein Tco_0011894 [Tanacetum coccineum]